MERDELKKTMVLLDRIIMSMDMKGFPLELFNGQMGICIYFFYLTRLQDNPEYRAFAEKLLQHFNCHIIVLEADTYNNGISI